LTTPIYGPEYGFGLYVHWPYCTRICPYCDFNVYAAKSRDTRPLLDAILQDIWSHRILIPDHPPLNTIFLGGGTPSLLSAAEIAEIIETSQRAFGLNPNIEITLEANPNDVLGKDPRGWLTAGVTRLSLGIQSLDDAALSFLGRQHSHSDAIKAAELASKYFANTSLDLIYARPGQSEADWYSELTEALSLGCPHLSLYELTIETNTAFGKRAARGDLVPMPTDAQADLYELTQEICETFALPAYEVSNHAAAEEYKSIHNMIYWQSGDWIGVGPGAHGRLTIADKRYATVAAKSPQEYANAQVHERSALSQQDIAVELLSMGLRSDRGIDRYRIRNAFGDDCSVTVMSELQNQKLLQPQSDQRLVLTPHGRLLADYVTQKLLP